MMSIWRNQPNQRKQLTELNPHRGLHRSRWGLRRMAGSTLDQLAEKSAAPDQQAKRKRRLVKGPSEFRAMRDDSPKRRRNFTHRRASALIHLQGGCFRRLLA